MKKNSRIHLWLETELKEKLENHAKENNISLNELCRQKLRENDRLSKIEYSLEQIQIILNKYMGG